MNRADHRLIDRCFQLQRSSLIYLQQRHARRGHGSRIGHARCNHAGEWSAPDARNSSSRARHSPARGPHRSAHASPPGSPLPPRPAETLHPSPAGLRSSATQAACIGLAYWPPERRSSARRLARSRAAFTPACACSTCARSAASSSTTKVCPARTLSPSRTSTCWMRPITCAETTAVSRA